MEAVRSRVRTCAARRGAGILESAYCAQVPAAPQASRPLPPGLGLRISLMGVPAPCPRWAGVRPQRAPVFGRSRRLWSPSECWQLWEQSDFRSSGRTGESWELGKVFFFLPFFLKIVNAHRIFFFNFYLQLFQVDRKVTRIKVNILPLLLSPTHTGSHSLPPASLPALVLNCKRFYPHLLMPGDNFVVITEG